MQSSANYKVLVLLVSLSLGTVAMAANCPEEAGKHPSELAGETSRGGNNRGDQTRNAGSNPDRGSSNGSGSIDRGSSESGGSGSRGFEEGGGGGRGSSEP